MISAIMGDYFGSIYEDESISSYNLPLISPASHITDESVAIAAVCDVLVNNLDYAETFLKWFNRYPGAEYGFGTASWIEQNDCDYIGNSDGNLAASRSVLIGHLDLPLSLLLDFARDSAIPTHNTEDGINGAKAMVYTIWALKNNKSQRDVFSYLFTNFDYLMEFYTLEQLKQTNETGCSAFNTVPISIWIAMTSTSYEDALRNCLYINSASLDLDSIMSMTSSIAFAYFFGGNIENARADKMFKKLEFETKKYLFKNNQDILQIVQEFEIQKDILGIPF